MSNEIRRVLVRRVVTEVYEVPEGLAVDGEGNLLEELFLSGEFNEEGFLVDIGGSDEVVDLAVR